MFIVDEHAERLWLPQRHGPAIVAMLGRHQISRRRLEITDLKRFVAGADVFSKQSDGSTVASQYAKLGITLRCANTDRVNGWLKSCIALATPGRGSHRACSFMSAARGWSSAGRRCNMIRIGLKTG